MRQKILWLLLPLLLVTVSQQTVAQALADHEGPQRVVSLSPAATEMLVRLHAGYRLVGITRHSTAFGELVHAKVVGGFLHPVPDLIEQLNPDLLIYSSLHEEMVKELSIPGEKLCLDSRGIDAAFAQIRLLGKLFDREKRRRRLPANSRRCLIGSRPKRLSCLQLRVNGWRGSCRWSLCAWWAMTPFKTS